MGGDHDADEKMESSTSPDAQEERLRFNLEIIDAVVTHTPRACVMFEVRSAEEEEACHLMKSVTQAK